MASRKLCGIVILYTFAYAFGLGDSVEEGVVRAGMFVAPAYVKAGIGVLLVFLLTSCVAGLAFLRVANFQESNKQDSTATALGVAMVLVAAATDAFTSGAWSHYGGQSEHAVGGVRLEPDKYEYSAVTCETTVRSDSDLPCTPSSEAYLAFGIWGVLLLGLVWGAYICLCELCMASGKPLLHALGLYVFAPIVYIETSSFRMFYGLRNALILFLPLAIVAGARAVFRTRSLASS